MLRVRISNTIVCVMHGEVSSALPRYETHYVYHGEALLIALQGG